MDLDGLISEDFFNKGFLLLLEKRFAGFSLSLMHDTHFFKRLAFSITYTFEIPSLGNSFPGPSVGTFAISIFSIPVDTRNSILNLGRF